MRTTIPKREILIEDINNADSSELNNDHISVVKSDELNDSTISSRLLLSSIMKLDLNDLISKEKKERIKQNKKEENENDNLNDKKLENNKIPSNSYKPVITSAGNIFKQNKTHYIPKYNVKVTKYQNVEIPTSSSDLGNFNYMTLYSDSNYIACGDGLKDILLHYFRSINLTIYCKNRNGVNEIQNFEHIVDLELNNKYYEDTTTYKRDNTLATILPLDILRFSNTKLDLALYSVEIYQKDDNYSLKLIDSSKLNTLGNNYFNDNDKPEDNAELDQDNILSTTRDDEGNVYVIKQNIQLEQIDQFLNRLNDNSYDILIPTNKSEYAGINSDSGTSNWEITKPIESNDYYIKSINKKHGTENDSQIRNLPINDSSISTLSTFECYIRGFLIFNTNDKSNTSNYYTTCIWLDTPTLFKIEKENNKYKIKIGNFIEANQSVSGDNYDIKFIKLNDIQLLSTQLPYKSTFYNTNFNDNTLNGFTFTIESLAKYWDINEDDDFNDISDNDN